jgi:trimethylamine--corrinoid protein Co-methyltransferase
MSFRNKPRREEGEETPRVHFEILGAAGREAVHESTVEVLGEVGVKVVGDEALDILDTAGCTVERGTQMVRIPRKVLEEALESAPGTILLASRDGRRDYLMGGRVVGYTNFGEGTKVYDLESGELRESTLADVGDTARLCDAMEMTATYERAVAPNDAPEHAHDIYAFEACLRNTTKHIHIGANNGEHVNLLVEMAAVVAGGRSALRERPIFSLNTCPTSPLQLHTVAAEVIVEGARNGVPVNVLSMAMAGASSPISLSGALVTHNAEVLAGIVLSQATNPGAPVMYGSSTTTFDMTYATAPVGAPELALISAAVAEMSDYYYLPCWVAGG